MKKIVTIVLILLFAFSASLAFAFPAVQVYQQTVGSVVLIVASAGGSGSMMGTGSIITKGGAVITNAHVILDNSTGRPYRKISVYTKPDEVTGDLRRDLIHPHSVTVAAYDKDLDLAVLNVKGLTSADGIITMANAREIMVGEEVVAIGHPEQGGLWTLTYGRISSQISNQQKVKGKDVFQTDTALNRGNSGGPLLDRRGYMVGVNTNIARRGSGDLAITGVNFAIKSSVVTAWLGQNGLRVKYGTEPLYPVAAAQAAPEPKKMEREPEPVREQPVRKAKKDKPVAQPESVRQESERVVEPEKEKPIKSREHKARRGRDQKVQPEKESTSMAKPDKPMSKGAMSNFKSGEMLTPKRPFTQEDLFKQVEVELEDMMNDIKMKFR